MPQIWPCEELFCSSLNRYEAQHFHIIEMLLSPLFFPNVNFATLIPFIRDVGISGGLQFNLPLVPINIYCSLPCFKAQMKFIFLGGGRGGGGGGGEGRDVEGRTSSLKYKCEENENRCVERKREAGGNTAGLEHIFPGRRALPRDAPRAEGSPAASFPGGAGSRRGEGRDGNRPAPRPAPGRCKCTIRPRVKPPSLPGREENASLHPGKAEARPAALRPAALGTAGQRAADRAGRLQRALPCEDSPSQAAAPRRKRGRRCREGGPGNCNSLWMGWTGRGGERSQASTSINLPSGRQAGAAAAPALPVSGMIQPKCAAPALPGQRCPPGSRTPAGIPSLNPLPSLRLHSSLI